MLIRKIAAVSFFSSLPAHALVIPILDATRLVSAECAAHELTGELGLFNLWANGHVEQADTSVDGRLAVGGEGRSVLRNFRVGAMLPAGNRLTMLVNGPLDFQHGTIEPSNVIYGRTRPAIAETVGIYGDVYAAPRQENVTAFFQDAQTELVALSARLAALEWRATVDEPASVLALLGGDRGTSVFHVDADVLAPGNPTGQLRLTAPADSAVIITVAGTDIELTDVGFVYAGGVEALDVVYNFPEARRIKLSGIGVQGTIVAPNAHLDFTDGVIHGNVYVASLTGNGHVDYVFAACEAADAVGAIIARLGWRD